MLKVFGLVYENSRLYDNYVCIVVDKDIDSASKQVFEQLKSSRAYKTIFGGETNDINFYPKSVEEIKKLLIEVDISKPGIYAERVIEID